MTLAAGTRLGPYEIVSAIGAGGMGEVYQALDTRLDRIVAVKVLSSHLSSSPDVRERFKREARTISHLSHPHICALYDVGEAPNPEAILEANPESPTPEPDPIRYLVMELLDGETLAARLMRGALPIEQVLRYGIEIADALDTAHRQGVVHRDLKPGNVMITRAGVKLLDFGLAKAIAAPPHAFADMSVVATAAVPADLTEEGTFLGTLQYMAPEQLEGRPADARTDIFALGTILYEMATGTKPFAGGSRIALASAILHDEPPSITSRQPTGAAGLDRLIRICLAKDPEQRWQTAHDIRLQLTSMRESPSSIASGELPAAPSRRRWMAAVPWMLAAVAAALAIVAWLRPASTPLPTASAPIRFSIPPPAGGAFTYNFEQTGLALSPDGSRLAFTASDATGVARLWLRKVSDVDPQPVAGTEGASALFWSPDGRSIAFFAGDKLKRIDLAGGAPVSLCDVRRGIGMAGTWGKDGQILYSSVEGEAIFRVSTSGGGPVPDIKPDRSQREIRVVWPSFLPDGERFLYVKRLEDRSDWLMLSEPGRPPRQIMQTTSNVEYVDPGYLVFAREGTLIGQRFDLRSGHARGDTFSVADPVRYLAATGLAIFTTSRNGALVYQPRLDQSHIAWHDRTGHDAGAISTGWHLTLRLSPDGRTAAFDRAQPRPGTPDLWKMDLDRNVETVLISDPDAEVSPVWLPDGRRLVFSANRAGPPQLFIKDLATGREQRLLPRGPRMQAPLDVTPDGSTVVFTQRAEGGHFDLWTVPVDGHAPPSPLVQSPFEKARARLSPDGRFFAYSSNESGRFEVYVAPYPAGEKTRVSPSGGFLPRWSRDGRELFYVSGDHRLMSVSVRTSPSLQLGSPQALFALSGRGFWIDFDPSLDGKKFLAIVPDILGGEQPLTAVLNWTASIAR